MPVVSHSLLIALLAGIAAGQQLPLQGLAAVGVRVSNLESARQFYSGLLGFEEAFAVRDGAGQVRTAYFKINDDQYLEVSPGLAPEENIRRTHIAIRTSDARRLRARTRF